TRGGELYICRDYVEGSDVRIRGRKLSSPDAAEDSVFGVVCRTIQAGELLRVAAHSHQTRLTEARPIGGASIRRIHPTSVHDDRLTVLHPQRSEDVHPRRTVHRPVGPEPLTARLKLPVHLHAAVRSYIGIGRQ